MHLRKSLLAAFSLLFWVPFQAFAWNSVGHMTAAYAAYQQLTAPERARVAVLLKLNPYYSEWLQYIPAGTTDTDRDLYIFMMASTWPDEIKASGSGYTGTDTPPHGESLFLNIGYSDKQAHKYWHYIDKPFSPDNTPLPPVPAPNAVQKITAFRAALASREPELLKSYDLVWLEHLVGDIHQPLHCATRVTATERRGDEGGNLVAVAGPVKNLHAFWDDAIGIGETRDFMVAVQAAQNLPQPDPTIAADQREGDWAAESFKLARQDAYATPVGPGLGPYTLPTWYTVRTQRIANERVALAGARLAGLLKIALKCGKQSCAN